jgi:hypothetical protein
VALVSKSDNIVDPEDTKILIARMRAAHRAADELQKRSMLLGYNVTFTSGMTLGDRRVEAEPIGDEAGTRFHVWRIDKTSYDSETFTTVEAVNDYLDQLETLPRFCLELQGNPRIEEVSEEHGPFTLVTDNETGQIFMLRTRDLETIAKLHIHAETAPTIGNWREV